MQAKDIQYLLYEPVLAKLREQRSFSKKLAKAHGKRHYLRVKHLENSRPCATLDHVVKERYPSFTDALRDLDDALSTIFLFANIPTNSSLPINTILNCQRLCNEWQRYIIHTNCLQKSFLSIKGIYYQAEVLGQDILWLVPYKFAQNVPADIDFRIMHTFVEFYASLLSFVLFKLYAGQGFVYPPKLDEKADSNAGGFNALRLEPTVVGLIPSANARPRKEANSQMETVSDKITSLLTENDETQTVRAVVEHTMLNTSGDAMDSFPIVVRSSVLDTFPQPSPHTGNWKPSSADHSALFAPYVFYLSRETPREALEFLLRSFGCRKIGWDPVLGDGAFTETEADLRVTHQIVDRAQTSRSVLPSPVDVAATETHILQRVPSRIYVQPQYIWDCINAGRILPPAEYGPGELLPPHLSPWISTTLKGYNSIEPFTYAKTQQFGEIEQDADQWTGMKKNYAVMEGSNVESKVEQKVTANKMHDDYRTEDGVENDELLRRAFQEELEAEAVGAKFRIVSKENERKSQLKKYRTDQNAEIELKEMQMMMMPQRKRKLYEKMMHGNIKKDEEAERLRNNRRNREIDERIKR